MSKEEVETEEVEEVAEEEVAAEEPEVVQPIEEVSEEVAPPEVAEEEVVEEKLEEVAPPVEALPNIFVADYSIPPGTLSGGRTLVVVDEKKAYPMSEEVNAWVLSHGIPIKIPTPEIERQMKKLGIVGQTTFPNLAALAEKLGE